MAKFRSGRVGEQMKKLLSQLIQTEVKDPRIGFVTVTGVDVTNDLSQANVYVSVMGDEEQIKQTMTALAKVSGFLRSEISKRIQLRRMPELLFNIDTSIEYGGRIEKLLSELQQRDDDTIT